MADGNRPTGALFPRWTNTAARAILLALACLLVGGPVALMAWVRTPNATGRGAPVAQPIAFDHVVHAHDLQIDCRYCHFTAERAATAGLPPTSTCVPCHNDTWMNGPVFAPVRQSLASGNPIAWNRVHKLPDFVYFNHAIHVAKGVGCESCHGRVDQMHQVRQTQPLTMGWCLSCHRDPAPNLRPPEDVAVMGWKPPVASPQLGAALAEENHVRRLTNCTACHR